MCPIRFGSRPGKIADLLVATLLLSCFLAAPIHAESPHGQNDVHEARLLLSKGNYAEATEAYSKLAATQPVDGAIGRARSLAAVGKLDEAAAILTAAIKRHQSAGKLRAELALLALNRGDSTRAREQADAALQLTADGPKQAAPRWILAELDRRSGKLEAATAGYKWLVDLYDRENAIDDPEVLNYIGLGAAQYARWKRQSDQFNVLVNDFYPELLKLEPNFWQAHYETGRLYAEKFNEADAASEFNAALALNPNAAEVHAAIASLAIENYDLAAAQSSLVRSLAVNPSLLWAHQLEADVDLANFESARALDDLQSALKLDPTNESTLGRIGAAYVALDGNPKSKGTAARPRRFAHWPA